MSQYLKPVYEFLSFHNGTSLDEVAEKLTQMRVEDISFRVISYSHVEGGMWVLIEKTVLTEIE